MSHLEKARIHLIITLLVNHLCTTKINSLTCPPELYHKLIDYPSLYPYVNECVENCGPGIWIDDKTKECKFEGCHGQFIEHYYCVDKCLPGYFFNEQIHACSPCNPSQAVGYYSDIALLSSGFDWNNLSQNSRSRADCYFCPPSSHIPHQDVYECIPCPPGKDNPTPRYYGECKQCQEGKFRSATGFKCDYCPEGSTPNDEQTDCIQCPVGKYRSTPAQCTPCNPGTYAPTKGLEKCLHCPLGYFNSDYGGTTCDFCPGTNNQHLRNEKFCGSSGKCLPGTYKKNGYCLLCPENTYSNESDTTSCGACSQDTFSLEGQSSCISVSPGMGLELGTDGQQYLSSCKPGQSNPGNWNRCQPCFAGTYSSLANQASCLPCGEGEYTEEIGQTSCQVVPPGYTKNELGNIQLCPEGTYSSFGFSTCRACEVGKYATYPGSLSCQVPNAGQIIVQLKQPQFEIEILGESKETMTKQDIQVLSLASQSVLRTTAAANVSVYLMKQEPNKTINSLKLTFLVNLTGSQADDYNYEVSNLLKSPQFCSQMLSIARINSTFLTTIVASCSTNQATTTLSTTLSTTLGTTLNSGVQTFHSLISSSCPFGLYYHRPTQRCKSCPSGTSAKGISNENQWCEPCPRNTYSPGFDKSCLPCDPDYYSPSSSSTCFKCPTWSVNTLTCPLAFIRMKYLVCGILGILLVGIGIYKCFSFNRTRELLHFHASQLLTIIRVGGRTVNTPPPEYVTPTSVRTIMKEIFEMESKEHLVWTKRIKDFFM